MGTKSEKLVASEENLSNVYANVSQLTELPSYIRLLCTHFRALESGFNFSLRSEIDFGLN